MSRLAVYLVAGCALGEMESNVRFRELVMVSDAMETRGHNQYAPCGGVRHEAQRTSRLISEI
jgi:hypothetical protein